jgi:hypothetical protein
LTRPQLAGFDLSTEVEMAAEKRGHGSGKGCVLIDWIRSRLGELLDLLVGPPGPAADLDQHAAVDETGGDGGGGCAVLEELAPVHQGYCVAGTTPAKALFDLIVQQAALPPIAEPAEKMALAK